MRSMMFALKDFGHSTCSYRLFGAVRNTIGRTAWKHRLAQQNQDEWIQNHQPNDIYLQILGNGTIGGPRTVVVVAGFKRYFFNCGEGTQRLCREHKIKMKNSTVFLTSPKWENIGGLIGFVLTSQDAGIQELQINGYNHISDLFRITRSFVNLGYLKLRTNAKLEYADAEMNIRQIVHRKRKYDDLGNLKNIQLAGQDETASDSVSSYICKPIWKPAKISLELCVELGIPPGPHLAQLKAGHEITLPDGRIVKPSDVVQPSALFTTFVILECPTEDYIDSFLEAEEFKPYDLEEGALEQDIKNLIVHITPKNVFESAKYKLFLQRFSPKAVHLQLCAENSHDLSAQAHRAQYQLNLIHNEIFPLLRRSSVTKGVAALTRYNVRPHTGLDDETKLKIMPQQYIGEAMASPNFEQELAELKTKLEKTKVHDQREYPLVTFFGTGSAIPSKDRNVSGILLTTKPSSHILLDCGEGTWGQMIRHYGPEDAEKVLKNLKCVYVSHMHPDHHLGLISIIKERIELGVKTRLRVLGPPELRTWLDLYSEVFERLPFEFVNCLVLCRDKQEPSSAEQNLIRNLFSNLAVNNISACLVPHTKNAFAIRVDTNGYSVVYSGDTKYCLDLIRLGEGCDLLIHEATMEDGLEELAKRKRHSTTMQAVQVGNQMNAKFTLLTHFSQRYCKLPNIDDAIFEKHPVGCAFDHMEIAPKHLQVLPHLYPSLKSLFAEHVHHMNENSSASNIIRRLRLKEEARREQEKDNLKKLIKTLKGGLLEQKLDD
ncbi:zinc phosphodiesterase ELAC protein 2-like isoform X2 [Varroa destructor]|uniref:ribonuclease Z n=1 Tax=Varroa destructor TaxID=109461 RepID=A0A7M7JKW4_VARDE|nr:zinc phosphodiesterase ELAC protein 2-like isoform X2 [Varroa destructor]